MLQKQAGHGPVRHVILVPGVSPVRSRRGAHYARGSTPARYGGPETATPKGSPHTHGVVVNAVDTSTHTPIDRKKKKDACRLLLLRTGPFTGAVRNGGAVRAPPRRK